MYVGECWCCLSSVGCQCLIRNICEWWCLMCPIVNVGVSLEVFVNGGVY